MKARRARPLREFPANSSGHLVGNVFPTSPSFRIIPGHRRWSATVANFGCLSGPPRHRLLCMSSRVGPHHQPQRGLRLGRRPVVVGVVSPQGMIFIVQLPRPCTRPPSSRARVRGVRSTLAPDCLAEPCKILSDKGLGICNQRVKEHRGARSGSRESLRLAGPRWA